jgi:ubiquinone/menaquinone biosynthesis C-methylase UbiE
LAFPKAKIVAADLSAPYLKMAQKKLADRPRIDFVQSDGSHLPFQDGEFDAVYSVFLFHELPLQERLAVLHESMRVLKPGGWIGLVDSIQMGDRRDFEQFLLAFPQQFHEPFYRNYVQHPISKLLEQVGAQGVGMERGFFSKACWGTKPAQV